MGLLKKITDHFRGNPKERLKTAGANAATGGLYSPMANSGNRTLENLAVEARNITDVKKAAKDVKAYYNPEMPATPGPEAPDLELLRSQAEEASRRRRGLAGRSLLRSSLGGAGTGNGTLLGGTR